jgi:mono/diheme cytochrome c family protein
MALVCASAAAHAADSANGQRLAERWCASCHVVSAGQRQASADVAPFASIAKIPDFNAQKLAYFLLAPHPKMPDMALSRREAEDMAAYIAALGR